MSRLLDGDGRESLVPNPDFVYPGTVPLRVTRGQARGVIHRFTAVGHSIHSGLGGVLWVILEHCDHENIGVLVSARDFGYYVEAT